MTDVEIIEADYSNERHAADILEMTDRYARDPMGLEEPLPEYSRKHLIGELRNMPTALSFLAYKDEKAVGVANCFVGFSTFSAKKLINIHDIAVVPEARGQGIGEQLLAAVQKKAKQMKCCKLTLEVRDDNPAKRLYLRFGFEEDDPRMWFLTKELIP